MYPAPSTSIQQEATTSNLHGRDISSWGLPPLVCNWFKKKGIANLFDWQVECLIKNDVLTGGNLVYSAPTSAGKTLVADILLLKKVLTYGKKALVIEPFVALTREKAAFLKSMLHETKARVGAFGGSYYTPGGFSALTVAVCTIEKANNIINRLIDEDKLSDLGIIVVDEIHHLGDPHRGYQLELLLTKTLYHNKRKDKQNRIQLVGLSATIPNLESIAIWLNASLYVTHYRPVPLEEKIKIGNKIYRVQDYIKNPACDPIDIIDPNRIRLQKDSDDLCYLCVDSIAKGHSCLTFCESKRECEVMAINLACQIKTLGSVSNDRPDPHGISQKLRDNISRIKIQDTLNKLRKCPAGMDKELRKSVCYGVAFHHAGLTSEEREIIEDGFKGGAIKVLMATSTLSSGVNLPARRVIIKSPTMISSSNGVYQKEMLNPVSYRQMIGRAGRKNIDTCGESILICCPETQDIAFKLIRSSMNDINSSLGKELLTSDGQPGGLKKAILEVIANGTAISNSDLNQYLKSTFWLCCQTSSEEAQEYISAIKETLRYLLENRFIEKLKPEVYRATRLGSAVLASGLHPDESLELLNDLTKARQGFILLNDLHIIYQITPNDIARTVSLNWLQFHQIWTNLDQIDLTVAELVGVSEDVILLRCQGRAKTLSEEKERVYRRFWLALVVNDIINEVSLPTICKKFEMKKATVQQVQRAVGQYAGVMSIFCRELGYKNIAALLTPLELRINSSCHSELLELIKLNINRPISRSLFDAGYKNITTLAHADKLDIEFVINQAKPFDKEFGASESGSLMWVPELVKTMSTLDYASHIVETAKAYFELDLIPTATKRPKEKQAEPHSTVLDQEQANKRSRLESTYNGAIQPQKTVITNFVTTIVPNFSVCQIGRDSKGLDEFMRKWLQVSAISVNFKRLNENVDEKEYKKAHLFACFNDDTTVYVIDKEESLKYVSENLCMILTSDDRLTSPNFVATKLYTQDIILTYKILHLGFNLTKEVLNKYFDWHSFEVAWWLINNCPTRGYKNKNSSLSLVSETSWARDYHHFLYPDKQLARLSDEPIAVDYDNDDRVARLKIIVKSGKTAILKPLIDEIVFELENRGQSEAYSEVEIKSRLAIADMIIHGIGLDSKAIKDEMEHYKELDDQLEHVAQKYYAKSTISLNRVKDVARVLYEDLDLKKYLLEHNTNTDISKNSTAAEILNLLSKYHPFPKIVQDFRSMGKAREALRSVNHNGKLIARLDMMRVCGRCDFWSATGRVAMSEPDLFLINRNFVVTIPAHGNRESETIDCKPRRCFVPSSGRLFVAADYSQLELRLLAHYSLDSNLLNIVNAKEDSNNNNEDSNNQFTGDIFKMVASKIYGKPVNEITSEDRHLAKQICYGIIYGMGNTSLGNQLGLDNEKAEEFRQYFFNAFPSIKAYTEQLIHDCEQTGYVKSLLGRRRLVEGIKSGNQSVRSKAERVAINTTIQSSASDVIKLSMKAMDEQILANYSDAARLVLEMHDELIYEVKPEQVDSFSKILKHEMENISSLLGLQVQLLVKLKMGSNWSDLQDYTPAPTTDTTTTTSH